MAKCCLWSTRYGGKIHYPKYLITNKSFTSPPENLLDKGYGKWNHIFSVAINIVLSLCSLYSRSEEIEQRYQRRNRHTGPAEKALNKYERKNDYRCEGN